jgi:major membrane immunogen (membrane-anchored lipoprotein)
MSGEIETLRMKNPTLAILIIIGVSFASSCSCRKDELDKVKPFKPDDKYFKSALVKFHFMLETSPVNVLDSLFNNLVNNYDLPVSAEGAKDGTYRGVSPYDAFDYRHEVKIKIKDGKIIQVDYNEVKRKGIWKQEDSEYCDEMSVTGTTPAIAYPAMEDDLLSHQNLMEVDGFSGATYSLYRFRFAVMVALIQAYNYE